MEAEMANLLQTMADLTLLASWAPSILSQGEDASLSDLGEIITLRARVDRDVPAFLGQENPVPFQKMLDADRACAPMARTLLWLPEDQALNAAERAGSWLNPLSWYGVHAWDMTTNGLDYWTAQVASFLPGVHQAEVMEAYENLQETMGPSYTDRWFFTERGGWKGRLDSDDRGWLTYFVRENRARKASRKGNVWDGFKPVYREEC
jgi:hypothetical protein